MDNRLLSFLEKILIIYIVSLILFCIADVPYVLYCIIAICICFLLRVKYKHNLVELCSINSIVLFSVTVGYFTAIYIVKDTKIIFDTKNTIISIMLATFFLAYFVTACCATTRGTKKKFMLMEQQKHDVDRIVDYINKFEIIGINGIWGSGKSFVTDYIQENSKISDDYIFVKIDLLSCNLEKIHLVIFDSIARVLNNERVFSKNAKLTKKLLSNTNVIDNIYSALIADEISYSNSLDTLKQELNNLEKKIILVYEDIDRITELDTIKKIFSISEQLVCDKIKIIYQYDNDGLENIGLDRIYIEKYIPYIVNLTPIPLISIIKYLLENNFVVTDKVSIEDFRFLIMPTYFKFGKIEGSISPSINMCSIRKVIHFLYELVDTLENNEEYQTKESKKTVIAFFAIKHLFCGLYEEFGVAKGVLDSATFEYEQNHYTIIQLLNYFKKNDMINQETFNILFRVSENANKIFFVENLGYNIDILVENDVGKKKDIYGESIRIAQQLDKNDKVDRLVWNLLCSGKSEFTNNENAVNKFIDQVLEESPDKQDEAYRNFDFDMFNGNLYKDDNTTIFKFGVSPMFCMFRAFYIVNPDTDSWIKLLDFYLVKRINRINDALIGSLRYCALYSNKVYIHILKKFNTMSIVGNLNDAKHYVEFLNKYLRVITSIGYIAEHDLWQIDGFDKISTNKDVFINVLDTYIKKMNELKDGVAAIEQVVSDIDVIITFLEKNKEIINCAERVKEEPLVQTKYHTTNKNQEEYDRLLKEKGSSAFSKVLEESYCLGNISPYEIKKLLE